MNNDNQSASPDPNSILLVGFLAEAALGVIAFLWIVLADLPLAMSFDPVSVLWGLAFAAPLLVIGIASMENPSITSRIPEYDFFKTEIIIPLCVSLTPGGTLLIALMSGLCEELLFRGALGSFVTSLFGSVAAGLVTSIVFAATHFIGVMWRFRVLLVLYTIAGGYLWIEYIFTGDLLAPMVTHAFYNYVVISFVRKKHSGSNS